MELGKLFFFSHFLTKVKITKFMIMDFSPPFLFLFGNKKYLLTENTGKMDTTS